MPTPNHSYNTPPHGTTDWHTPLNENFDDIDADVEIRALDSEKDTFDALSGAKFLATDTRDIYLGDGSAWNHLGKVLATDAGEVIIPQWTFDSGVQVGQDPSDTITETGSPKGFTFTAGDHRDIHEQTDVTISNSSGGSATEDITVELYDGTDTSGTLVDSETKSVGVSDGGSVTETFIASRTALDGGDYHLNVTQSGSTLSIDQTDEYTTGATHAWGETGDGTFELTNQDGETVATVDPITNAVTTGGGWTAHADGSESLPAQDLSTLSLGSAEDHRMYRHDGSSSINADGGTTSAPGYYAWDNSTTQFQSIVQF